MLTLEGFYGQTVDIADDRLYDAEEELWVQARGDLVRVGVSEVGVLLMGGVESTEFFVEVGDILAAGEDLVFFETFKAVRYVVSPIAGEITAVNHPVVDDPELFDDDPYGEAWLVEMRPAADQDLQALLRDPITYLHALERSEHCAEGAEVLLEAKKGSPTCRSVYGGIRGNEPGEGSLSWKEGRDTGAPAVTPAEAPDGAFDAAGGPEVGGR
ncbi:MAG: glycine cleavage system protein H [Thermoleophilia bacterium]